MRNPFKREKDPFSAAAYSDVIRSVRKRERKHMRHWWQWALLGAFVLITAAAGLGIWLYYSTQCKIACRGPDLPEAPEGQPFNALLVGSDSRTGLTAAEQQAFGANPVPGQRADTIILAHIDPESDFVTMVQFPRDFYVTISGRGEAKINSSLEGGARLLIRTMEEMTGLRINRYVQVNLAGFKDVVNAIGGVDVCITEPIPFDPNTGLQVTEDELGMVHFDGIEALRFVRSRRFTTGDFERIQNQQKFLAAAIRKVTSVSTFLNPFKIKKLADVAGENLRTDQSTTILGLRSLVSRFRAVDPQSYEAYTAPNFGVGAAGEQSIVVPDWEALDLMFEAIAQNQSPAAFDGVPDVDPTTIQVGIYNGTGEEGLAEDARAKLEEATDTGRGPVEVVDVGNAPHFRFKETIIRYEPSARAKAELVGAAIPGAILKEGRTPRGVDVALIVGKKGVQAKRIIQLRPLDIPPPSELPAECR